MILKFLLFPFKLIYEFIKRLIITILLIPLVIFGFLLYDDGFLHIVYYVWAKPRKAHEIWEQFKQGVRNFKEGKEKLQVDKRFFVVMAIAFALIALRFILK